MTTEKIIKKLQKTGKKEYAELLIETYYQEIYVFAYRQIRDKDHAMDLTQEIFISMLRSINRYDSEKAGFRTWLYRIATNKTIDHFRRNSSQTNQILYLDQVEVADDSEFVEQIIQDELMEQMLFYVNTLDQESQYILRYKFFSGFTFTEIAEQMGLKESTVKTKYYRLIEKIRKEFRDDAYYNAE